MVRSRQIGTEKLTAASAGLYELQTVGTFTAVMGNKRDWGLSGIGYTKSLDETASDFLDSSKDKWYEADR
uniref:Bm9945 n=1 Tax=Brugia malayi TaxID=6279 RepID=A0A1I9GD97_BRUMA|nr:Bm9945 [Brugia malayi]